MVCKEILFHVGLPKTGTTTIQKYLTQTVLHHAVLPVPNNQAVPERSLSSMDWMQQIRDFLDAVSASLDWAVTGFPNHLSLSGACSGCSDRAHKDGQGPAHPGSLLSGLRAKFPWS